MARKNIPLLFVFLALTLSVGWIGGVATESSRAIWYAGLHKPPLNPPSWVFAPVWTVLYIAMAVAGWRIWNVGSPHGMRLRVLFGIQLALNGIWSFLFFALRSPAAGFLDIACLWAALVILVKWTWRMERPSSILLAPYLAWVTFAAYLNAAIWWLNR